VANPSVFGEIPGYTEGSVFDSREALRAAGLHRHGQAGISGAVEDGADAIIVSGGYPDDRDEGDRIIYTGQGGQNGTSRQVRDQELTRGNLALVRSEERGLPVRVIRGAHRGSLYAPTTGYRYDGLFTVIEHWSEPSVDGPLVWRFVLEKADGGGAWQEAGRGETPAAPTGEQTPGRARSVTQRVVRNSAVTQWVKDLHDHTCQVCGIRLEVDGGAYAEGAHVRALGRPHNGSDVTENVLCLCPNDHVLFDKGAIYISGGKVHRTVDRAVLRSLRVHPDHRVDEDAIRYQRERFAGIR
jgi:putative restriction endonuclease